MFMSTLPVCSAGKVDQNRTTREAPGPTHGNLRESCWTAQVGPVDLAQSGGGAEALTGSAGSEKPQSSKRRAS